MRFFGKGRLPRYFADYADSGLQENDSIIFNTRVPGEGAENESGADQNIHYCGYGVRGGYDDIELREISRRREGVRVVHHGQRGCDARN